MLGWVALKKQCVLGIPGEVKFSERDAEMEAAKELKRKSKATTTNAIDKKKKKKARVRTDTFWLQEDQANGAYFQSIYDGSNEIYALELGDTKLDYKGRERYCWRAINKNTGSYILQVRSAPVYRSALLWSIYTNPSFWKNEKHRERIKNDLPRIKSKLGDHCRHLCGHEWCCNPRHIKPGTRKINEADKHFHFFLNHEDPGVRAKFREDFADLMKKQGVW